MQHEHHVTTHHDTIPDFAAHPTIASVQNGAYADPATWDLRRAPTSDDVVSITHLVYCDTLEDAAKVIGIERGGQLSAAGTRSARLTFDTILVKPGGALVCGEPGGPLNRMLRFELVVRDRVIDKTTDPLQFGHGIVAIDGTVRLHGAIRSSFLRLAAEPKAGHTTLTMESAPEDWAGGDRLVLPDTRQLTDAERVNNLAKVPQWEEPTIASVAGNIVTLTAPLKHDHLGARDADGKLDCLPHVGHFSRNIQIRSDNPIGTRGHVLLTGRSDVDIRYVEFLNLGRTKAAPTGPSNQIGRYPLHAHHLTGPSTTPANGYQFTFIGNAINGGAEPHSFRWALAVHGSHYGLIQDNLAYHYHGWIIGTEDGSETENLFDHNFALRGAGDPSQGRNGGAGEANEGGGFTFRGPFNRVRNNVASGIGSAAADAAYGFKFALERVGNEGKVKVPKFKGADPAVAGQFDLVDANAAPVTEFDGNEVYGATQSGFTYWWVGSFGDTVRATQPTVFKNLKLWNIWSRNVFHYPSARVVLDGLTIRADRAKPNTIAWFGADYLAFESVIRNADIQGVSLGVYVSMASGGGTQTIEDSIFRNVQTAIYMPLLGTNVAIADWIRPVDVAVRGVLFDRVTNHLAWDTGSPTFDIAVKDKTLNLRQLVRVRMSDYQRVAGDSFRAYSPLQAPSFVMPQTAGPNTILKGHRLLGSPVAGLTNAQNWEAHKVAMLGEVAPCSNTRANIGGFICGGAAPVPTPAPVPVPVPAPTPQPQPVTCKVLIPVTITIVDGKIVWSVEATSGVCPP